MEYMENNNKEKKLYAYNIRIDLKKKFEEIAKKKGKSASALLNELLLKYVEEINGIEKKKQETPVFKFTEEERKADWEWRKQQVAQGKLPPEFADEYPVPKINSFEEEKNFEETMRKKRLQEDMEFEESIKASL
jgi:hypothetical protein